MWNPLPDMDVWVTLIHAARAKSPTNIFFPRETRSRENLTKPVAGQRRLKLSLNRVSNMLGPEGAQDLRLPPIDSQAKLDYILSNPKCAANFRCFARQTHVEESVDFLNAVNTFQDTVTQLARYTIFPDIFI